jgi:hypothetical protein
LAGLFDGPKRPDFGRMLIINVFSSCDEQNSDWQPTAEVCSDLQLATISLQLAAISLQLAVNREL